MHIAFDEQARKEYLTGFHKRKLARTELARKKAQEREKQERLHARREKRRLLRERAVENAALVEKAYARDDEDLEDGDDGEVWMGISPTTHEPEQFEDEEHLATVTVVEDFDPDTLIHGPPEPASKHDPNRSGEPGKSRAKSLGSELDKRTSKKVRYPRNGIRKGKQI